MPNARITTVSAPDVRSVNVDANPVMLRRPSGTAPCNRLGPCLFVSKLIPEYTPSEDHNVISPYCKIHPPSEIRFQYFSQRFC